MRTTTSVNHAGTRERDRFELDIVCPNCGASGGARVFEAGIQGGGVSARFLRETAVNSLSRNQGSMRV